MIHFNIHHSGPYQREVFFRFKDNLGCLHDTMLTPQNGNNIPEVPLRAYFVAFEDVDCLIDKAKATSS